MAFPFFINQAVLFFEKQTPSPLLAQARLSALSFAASL